MLAVPPQRNEVLATSEICLCCTSDRVVTSPWAKCPPTPAHDLPVGRGRAAQLSLLQPMGAHGKPMGGHVPTGSHQCPLAIYMEARPDPAPVQVGARQKRPLSEVLRDMEADKCSYVDEKGNQCGESVKKKKYNWKRHNELKHGLEVQDGALMINKFCCIISVKYFSYLL